MSRLTVKSYTLFACRVVADDCGVLEDEGRFCKLIVHMLLVRSLWPSKERHGSDMCSIINLSCVKMALYPLSQNCAMDNRALFVMSGKRWQWRAAIGRDGILRRAVCVASIAMLLGNFTVTPGAQGVMFVQWAFKLKKWLVQPESAMAASFCCIVAAASAYRLHNFLFTIECLFKLPCLLVILL